MKARKRPYCVACLNRRTSALWRTNTSAVITVTPKPVSQISACTQCGSYSKPSYDLQVQFSGPESLMDELGEVVDESPTLPPY